MGYRVYNKVLTGYHRMYKVESRNNICYDVISFWSGYFICYQLPVWYNLLFYFLKDYIIFHD